MRENAPDGRRTAKKAQGIKIYGQAGKARKTQNKKPLQCAANTEQRLFNVNICNSLTNVYYTMLTAETQAKTAGFTLLSGLVWGINILTIIYNIYLRKL